MVSADNGVDRTGVAAMRTADAERFVDNRDRRYDRFLKWYDFPAEKFGQPSYRVLSTRRAEINSRRSINKCGCERPTSRVAALGALRLWEEIIDCINEVSFA